MHRGIVFVLQPDPFDPDRRPRTAAVAQTRARVRPAARVPAARISSGPMAEPQRRLGLRPRPVRLGRGARDAGRLRASTGRSASPSPRKARFRESGTSISCPPSGTSGASRSRRPGAAAGSSSTSRPSITRPRSGSTARKRAGTRAAITPFSLDITDLLAPKDNVLVLRARDDVRSGRQPTGKQSEPLRLLRLRLPPHHRHLADGLARAGPGRPDRALQGFAADIDNGEANLHVYFNAAPGGGDGDGQGLVPGPAGRLADQEGRPDRPLRLRRQGSQALGPAHAQPLRRRARLREGQAGGRTGRPDTSACASSRSGAASSSSTTGRSSSGPSWTRASIRTASMTAPDDAALKRDIELSMASGFNGARLHQKVFERRFLYWADKLGYLVWGEFPDWGLDLGRPEAYPDLRPRMDRGRGARPQPPRAHRLVPVQRTVGEPLPRA